MIPAPEISAPEVPGESFEAHPLRDQFMKWQCRVRQMMMRDNQGRPEASIMPEVFLPGEDESLGAIITIMNKAPGHSVIPELIHMARRTNDPAQIRSRALQFFSATYYQKPREFSDILTATFAPGSAGAAQIHEAGTCRLVFEAYSQRFDLTSRVWRLAAHNPLYQATVAHNRLFNPGLPSDAVILGFEPDWSKSSAAS